MPIKRDKLDRIFSDLVRERAEWSCEFPGCGKLFPEGERGRLDCSHVEGRSKKSVRWYPDNALALCRGHHDYIGNMPLLHTQLVQSIIGERRFAELKRRAAEPSHFTPRQIEGLYRHYVQEYARLSQARANGRMGRIDFLWPDPIPEAEPRKRAKKAKAKGPKKKIPSRPFPAGKRKLRRAA